MRLEATGWGLVLAGAVFVSLGSVELQAQAGRARVQEGNRLYEQGLFSEAHQKYLEALAEVPESSIIPFNDGNALYQGNDYQKAIEAYQRAIETGDPAVAGAAWYNLGNAFFREQQLEQSLEAYKQALRLNPAALDAKHNLERVLEQMQQQDQQDQQDQGDPDPNQDDEEQDQGQPPESPNGDQPEDGEPDPQDGQPEDGEHPPEDEAGRPQPQEGEMTPEEAERLLDAVEENPDDVNRKPAAARGRRPKKPW